MVVVPFLEGGDDKFKYVNSCCLALYVRYYSISTRWLEKLKFGIGYLNSHKFGEHENQLLISFKIVAGSLPHK